MRSCFIGLLGLSACASCAGADGMLLIPDSVSDGVLAFSPVDGSILDGAFIVDPGVSGDGVDVFDRPIEVAPTPAGTLVVSDQFADVVSEFAADGTFVRVLSLGGVRDQDVINNCRGLAVGPSGDVLLANAGGTNPLLVSANNVKRLAGADGAERADFAFNGYGGLRGPFDVVPFTRDGQAGYLVSDEASNVIVRYDADGRFAGLFATDLDFPQQLHVTPANTVLVCDFSGGFIREYDEDGGVIGQYDPATLAGYRGVHELEDGNLLVTTSGGVFVVNRLGVLIATRATGSGFRYISWAPLPPGGLAPRPGDGAGARARAPAGVARVVTEDDERGKDVDR